MNKYIKATCLIMLSLTTANVAFAGDPTDPGTTSTGTSAIELTIPKLVKISGMRDFNTLGTYDGSAGGMGDSEDVCIYSNMVDAGQYTARLTGSYSGGGTGFAVKHDTLADTIAYSAFWNDQAGTNTGESAPNGSGDVEHQTGFSASPTCADVSGNNARYRISFSQAALLGSHTNRVRPGTYSGTLTILITPE